METVYQIMPVPVDEYPPDQLMPVPDELRTQKRHKRIKRILKKIQPEENDDKIVKNEDMCNCEIERRKEDTDNSILFVREHVIDEEPVQDPKQNRKGKFNQEGRQNDFMFADPIQIIKTSIIKFRWIIITICILGKTKSASAIHWELLSNPLVFGESVVLRCVTSSNDCSSTFKWIGGQDNKMLALNEGSIVPGKYTAEISMNCSYYDLHIANFSLEDVDVEYKCEQGFVKYENYLHLNRINYEKLPRKEDIQYLLNTTKKNIFGYISFKEVHPVPECIFSFKSHNLSPNAEVNGHNFRDVVWRFNDTIADVTLTSEVVALCSFGRHKESFVFLVNKIFELSSNGKQADDVVFNIIVAAVAALTGMGVLAVVGITIFFYFMCGRRNSSTCSKKDIHMPDVMTESDGSSEVSNMISSSEEDKREEALHYSDKTA